MKPLLNTLYITRQGSYLHKEGQTLVVRLKDEILGRVPLHTIQQVVCFGNVLCSPFLLGFCAERGVGVSFHHEHGRFLCRVAGPATGNVLLRRAQYRQADDPDTTLSHARGFITGKLVNARVVLRRHLRDHGPDPELERVANTTRSLLHRVAQAPDLDTLRGNEGEAARRYFSVFERLIRVTGDDGFAFSGRSRRPPQDPVNALLSFLYALLKNDVESALEAFGLDPAVGFLHRDRPGRASLALDLMEELRPVLADRLVLSLINRRQVSPADFVTTESGAVRLLEAARKRVIAAYQNRKRDELRHPFLDTSVPLGQVPYLQAWILSRAIRGDLDAYAPFVWN